MEEPTKVTPAVITSGDKLEKEKRLVLEHTDGPLKGLFRIISVLAQEPPSGIYGPLSIGGESHIVEFASLIEVHPRWCHYRELFKPALEHFNEPLKNNHPNQV